jgi:hypothetical protein
MEIKIKSNNGNKVINKIVNKTDTIGKKIEEFGEEHGFEGIEKLLYDGKILDTDKTFKEYNIPNGALLIGFIRKESKNLPRLSGLNGDTTYGFNMGEFISEVTKMMEELLKLSDEEIDKLLSQSQIVSNIKSVDKIPGVSGFESINKAIQTAGINSKKKRRRKTKKKYKKKKKTKKRKTRKRTKKKNMKGGWYLGPYGDNFDSFLSEIQTDIKSLTYKTDETGKLVKPPQTRHPPHPPEVIKILELMGDERWLRNLFDNKKEEVAQTAHTRGLQDALIAKLFMTDEDREEYVSLVERVIWYLWTVESNNCLYKLINNELRRRPDLEESQLFPASFKYLTQMTIQKTIGAHECPYECEEGADGYWRGISGPRESFWLVDQNLLHFEPRYNTAACRSDTEERAIFEASFMSWTSRKDIAKRFINNGNPSHDDAAFRVLLQLRGAIKANAEDLNIDYDEPVYTSLGRLKFFSQEQHEDEFLLNRGFLIFRCENRKRYTVDDFTYKYNVYYLSMEEFPKYVLIKAIQMLPSDGERKRVLSIYSGGQGGLFLRIIRGLQEHYFRKGSSSIEIIKSKFRERMKAPAAPAARSARSVMGRIDEKKRTLEFMIREGVPESKLSNLRQEIYALERIDEKKKSLEFMIREGVPKSSLSILRQEIDDLERGLDRGAPLEKRSSPHLFVEPEPEPEPEIPISPSLPHSERLQKPSPELAQLIDMGFNEQESQRALAASGGNVHDAAVILLTSVPAGGPKPDLKVLLNKWKFIVKYVIEKSRSDTRLKEIPTYYTPSINEPLINYYINLYIDSHHLPEIQLGSLLDTMGDKLHSRERERFKKWYKMV